jgi:hypothetical protein
VSSAGASSNLRACCFDKSERGAFVAVDRRALDVRHRIARCMAVAHQMLEQAGEGCQAPADSRDGAARSTFRMCRSQAITAR